MSKRNSILPFFLILFFLSGFSGLIYESIWTHYLKLFLGHSSYAQILVLGIFMGGMAIGAAVAAKLTKKLTNLILFYAIAEGIIGLLGITFHNLFVTVEAAAFNSIFPMLGEPWLVHLVKWSLASLMIIPQSMLLGATFPLLATGMIRRFPGNTGHTLAILYFVNSFGAAIGILFNVFWLIPAVGLPGAILTAGIINILIAITVYRLSKNDHYPAVQENKTNTGSKQFHNHHLFFLIAGFTGLASFMYEIGWIRMLTMVLGGSTHSFEIMLSAFILGIAIGGFWIKKKIENFSNPLQALGIIQLVMGALAVLTIPLYNQTYELMVFAIDALNKNDNGYLMYTLFSYFIALVVMLPATICAGTTLPLISFVLLKNKSDDSVIGKVYAWNTVGSILGVVLAVQIVMPLLGLKWVIIGGALVDVFIGLYIISRSGSLEKNKLKMAIIGSSLMVFLILPFTTGLDTKKMASGVFRYGPKIITDKFEVIFHKDGKTSTVAIKEYKSGMRVVLNNGKPDAGLIVSNNKEKIVSPDSATMILIGALPFVYQPEAKLIANIGLGSGLTAHTILHHENLQRLDTIEIEPAVFEAAQYFRPNVEKLFVDKRSNVIIDDAKTYFSAAGNKYDVIVSEPPNPWVSGVAGLFSVEFYQQINRYLDDDGILIQWIQLYEISPELVSLVYHALRANFSDIHLYQVANGDLAIVASRSKLTADYETLFQQTDLKDELARIDVLTPDDIAVRKLGDKERLDAVFGALGNRSNSDYFPLLDIGAGRTRFLNVDALSLYQLYGTRLLGQVLNLDFKYYTDITTPKVGGTSIRSFKSSYIFYQTYLELQKTDPYAYIAITKDENHSKQLVELFNKCSYTEDEKTQKAYDRKFIFTILNYFNFLQKHELETLFKDAKQCEVLFSATGKRFIDAHLAWLSNDFSTVLGLTDEYINDKKIINGKYAGQLLKLNLTSRIITGELQQVPIWLNKVALELVEADIEIAALFKMAETKMNSQ